MASVFRQDTGEIVGYLSEPEGPLPGGITYWPYKAWVHSDGKLRSEPEPGADGTTADVTLDIPVRNNDNSEVHLIVSPELVDFILSRADFRHKRPEPSYSDGPLNSLSMAIHAAA